MCPYAAVVCVAAAIDLDFLICLYGILLSPGKFTMQVAQRAIVQAAQVS